MFPLSGVYVVEVMGSFGKRRGVASFGLNPTVTDSRNQKCEVHLFDWHESLYGQRIQVAFKHKLRDEWKFDSLEALQHQIHLDMSQARVLGAELKVYRPLNLVKTNDRECYDRLPNHRQFIGHAVSDAR